MHAVNVYFITCLCVFVCIYDNKREDTYISSSIRVMYLHRVHPNEYSALNAQIA